MCACYFNLHLMDIPNDEQCDYYDPMTDVVILVHGAVKDCQLGQCYYAPCILLKTCRHVRRIGVLI